MQEIKPCFLGSLYGHGTSFAGAVWDKYLICPTITTSQGGGREPHILEIMEISKDDYWKIKSKK